ncbi:hypothetical protein BUE80_DR007103 [Diplocarpon rosae]|nr:hypothetical protein BUE80_DR007103 [Diplocarpon rosae]
MSTTSPSSSTSSPPASPLHQPQTESQASPFATSTSASRSISSSRPRTGTLQKASGKTGAREPTFTASMQDKQARNKDPFESEDSSSEEEEWGRGGRYGNDTYENIQKRRMAAVILDSPELLMMHSQARSDSIPGTRHYFTKILCGYEDDKKDTYPENGQMGKGKGERERKRHASGQGVRK